MAKIGQMPTRSQLARHITALTLLASFAACSHGSEPRHPRAQEPRAAADAGRAAPASRAEASEQSKRGVIRSAEPVSPPDSPAEQEAARPAEQGLKARALRAAPDTIPEADSALPDPKVTAAVPAAPGAATPVALKAAPASLAPRAETGSSPSTSYWPLYAGAAIAALSLLAVTLFRRRYRKAAQDERVASEAHAQEILRERDAALAQAAEQERLRMADELAEQAEAAEVAAAAAAQEQQRQQAANLAAVREHEQKSVDPRVAAAHQLHDLLHRAERDVEPFLRMLDDAVPADAASNDARQVVAAWHESMLGTRNRLSEALARHNVPVDLQVVEPAADLQSAVSRLIDHAARMSALMVTQQQPNSAILHWSRLLPGALIQLFWRAQTARYSSTMPQLPKVPDAPAPGAVAAPAPVPARPPARTQDKAIQQALRGVQRHAART